LNNSEHKNQKLILIGSSTGGPSHIQKILTSLPESFNAIVLIAQHMGDEYLESFTARLDNESKIKVNLAKDGNDLVKSNVYICTKKSEIIFSSNGLKLSVKDSEKKHYNPDINSIFISAVNLPKSGVEVMALILTGIGEDGVDGILALSKTNAVIIAESKESAVVFGMPMRAAELVKDIKVLPLSKIIEEINKFGV
jgi:two-component system chemotaxis response regulator CheB